MSAEQEKAANPCQRAGAISNTHAGRDFQHAVQQFLASIGLVLEPEFPLPVGFSIKKPHRFDFGSAEPPFLVECKSFTWTAGGNSPSARLRRLNEAMLFFSVATASAIREVTGSICPPCGAMTAIAVPRSSTRI